MLNQKAKKEKMAENAHKETFVKFMGKKYSFQPLPKHFPTPKVDSSIAELPQPHWSVPFNS